MTQKVKNTQTDVTNKEMLAEALVETEELNFKYFFSQVNKKNLLSLLNNKKKFVEGGALVVATFIANILNYIFNAYLGRVLTFNDFALIGLIGGFYSFATIFFGAYATTINYRSGFLMGKYGDIAGHEFWKYARKLVFYLSIILTVVWLLSIPLLMDFFHTNNIYLFLLFSLILLFGSLSYINQGFINARMMFGFLAIVALTDPIIKLLTTFTLVVLHLQIWAFGAIPLSVLVVFCITWIFITKKAPTTKLKASLTETHVYSKKFFLVTLLSGFASTAFFTFDIFLAKHFLSAAQAGEYTLISLVGKMIFFLGNLTAPFVIPLISRHEGANKDSLRTLYFLAGFTTLFVFVGFILFGILGFYTVPLLYGEKARVIVPYILFFTFGMACYTISAVFVNYYLVKKIYTVPLATSLLLILQIILISLFHDSVKAIATDMSLVLMANLFLSMSLHINIKHVEKFEIYLDRFFRNVVVKYHPGKLL